MEISRLFYRLRGKLTTVGRLRQCPEETELLDYTEGRLPARRQAQLESHFIGCEDCREFLALYAQISEEVSQAITPPPEPMSEEAIKEQTAKILTLIKQDEFNHRKQQSDSRTGYLAYAGLAAAVVVVLAAAAAIFLSGKDSQEEAVMQAIAMATRDERRVEPRISGGLAWSRYSVERGPEDDQQAIERAIEGLKSAEAESAPASSRALLARAYLASGERERAERALKILREVAASGDRSPAVLNDMGVAMFQLRQYREAASVFGEALEKDSNYEEALFNRALANYRAQLRDEARKDFARFIEVSSDEKWKAEARLHMDLLDRTSAP